MFVLNFLLRGATISLEMTMIRTAASSPEHDALVRNAVAALFIWDCDDIRADHIGSVKPLVHNGQPAEINGFIPDATGIRDGQLLIVECELCSEIESQHSHDQIMAFYQFAVQNGAKLLVWVEQGCVFSTRMLLYAWGIPLDSPQVDVWPK